MLVAHLAALPSATASGSVMKGLCGKSSTDKPVCEEESGFGASTRGDHTMSQCALRCLACERCAYATFSAQLSDCSLYRTCNATRLFAYRDYQTAHVAGTTEATWGGAAARAPLVPLVVPVQVGNLQGGVLAAIPPGAAPLLLEIGSSDRNTMDVEELPKLKNGFLVTAEPLLDKYARAIGRRAPADQVRDHMEPLSQHHDRGLVLPIAVGPAAAEGEQRTFQVGGTAGCSSLLNSSRRGSYGAWCQNMMERRAVWTYPLRTVLGWFPGPVDFVKIDAQGAHAPSLPLRHRARGRDRPIGDTVPLTGCAQVQT